MPINLLFSTTAVHPKYFELISNRTSAILAVHCYGYPCKVEAIQKIAEKHSLSVIYDAAHAFGVQIDSSSLLNFGDNS